MNSKCKGGNRNFPKGRRRIMVLVLYLRVQKPELQELYLRVQKPDLKYSELATSEKYIGVTMLPCYFKYEITSTIAFWTVQSVI
jgi:hypothetical protein